MTTTAKEMLEEIGRKEDNGALDSLKTITIHCSQRSFRLFLDQHAKEQRKNCAKAAKTVIRGRFPYIGNRIDRDSILNAKKPEVL